MADATLAIHLIDDGAGVPPAAPAPPNPSAPRPGPPSVPAAGPSSPPRDTQPIQPVRDTSTVGPPDTRGQLAPRQRWRGAPEAQQDDRPDLKDAAGSLVNRLAGATGIGGLANQVRSITGLFGDVRRVFSALAPGTTPATQGGTSETQGPALSPAITPQPSPQGSPHELPKEAHAQPSDQQVQPVSVVSMAQSALGTLASLFKGIPAGPPLPGVPKIPLAEIAPKPTAEFMQQQTEGLAAVPWQSGSRALQMDVPRQKEAKLRPTTRAAAESEFQRKVDDADDSLSGLAKKYEPRSTEGPRNLPLSKYNRKAPEQGHFYQPTPKDIGKEQGAALENWQMPKGVDLRNLDVGKTPGPKTLPAYAGVTKGTEATIASTAGPPSVPVPATVAPAVAEIPEAAGGVATALEGVAATIMANPVGVAVAAVVAGVVALSAAVVGMTKIFRSQTEKLAGYSFDTALAASKTELRKEFATMYRAEQIGPQVAKWENAGSRFDSSIDRLGTQVLKSLDKFGEPLLNVLQIATGVAEKSEKVWAWFNNAPQGSDIAGWFNPLTVNAKIANALLRQIAKALETKEEEDFTDPFMDAFLNQTGAAAVVANAPAGIARRPQAGNAGGAGNVGAGVGAAGGGAVPAGGFRLGGGRSPSGLPPTS